MPEWTEQQKQAIFTRGEDLLVSAAAGSGKTAVLAARVGEFIADGGNLDRLLVVTFTKLAAAEMRERIAKELRDRAFAKPTDAHLRRQSLTLYKANISTIDSFGIDLLRRNFHAVGISPDFSVLDESEVAVIKDAVLQGYLEECYRTFPEGFSDFLALFGGGTDDRELMQVITFVADRAEYIPFPDRWLKRQEGGFCDAQTVSKAVCELILPVAEEYCRILEQALQEPYKEKSLDNLNADYEFFCRLRDLLAQGNWDEACRAVSAYTPAPAASRPRGVTTAGMELYAEYRSKSKTQSENAAYPAFLKSEWFTLSSAVLEEDLSRLRGGVRFLLRAVAAFRAGVRAEMNRRSAYSFAVISEMALDLVVSEYDYTTGEFVPSQTALQERERYDEVLIDEYQDVNDLQDLFFRAITKDNCFAVGDVKQSIYGFRGSNPGNFLRKKETCKVIALNKNFRSRAGILDYVNFLFRGLFSKAVGGMEYDENEALFPGRAPDGSNPYPQGYADSLPPALGEEVPSPKEKFPEPHAEFLLIPTPSPKKRDPDEGDQAEGEARLCAKLISDAIRGGAKIFDKKAGKEREMTYSDVVILMRASKSVPVFEKVFRQAGIPLLSADGGTFLETPEVGGILAFLQAINDPWDDLSLFVTLTGNIFAFTPEEVSYLRDPRRPRPLWEGLLSAAEESPRWTQVIKTFEKYRILAENIPVARLIWQIYTATDYLALESASDPNARRNLMKFYTFACRYPRADGLFGFLDYADRARRSEQVKQNDAAPEGDFVRIMTIHKSKGLEFAWCLLPEMGKTFAADRAPLLVDGEYGVAPRVRNEAGTASYTTLLRELISLRQTRLNVAERLRVLYVALTRARDRLTVISRCSVHLEELDAHALHSEKGKVRLSTLLTQSNYRKILLDRTVFHPKATALQSAWVHPESVETEDLRVAFVGIPETVSGGDTERKEATCGLSSEDLKTRFSFRYDGRLSTVPAKVSVTEIAKDPPPPDAAILLRDPPVAKPQFLNEKALSATERGTALHTYCQFADFHRPVAEQKARLVREGHLSQAAAEAMEDELLTAFLTSPLMEKILSSSDFRREVRFVCRIPVSYYSGNPGDEGEMLMQGAMDLLYETEEGYVIVDFKSDRATEAELLERYSRQLNLYAAAVRRLYDKPVLGCVIWSFALKKEIPVREEML
ncbi:MAG: UvrD-helicase domain-containing protein [Clostridia bacterium]|nr:UvrD-helicase domain-containing protein [Clostridia bacterium]